MDGLQPWAKIELKRCGVQDLADAIAKAESLIDYTSRKESTPKQRDWKSVQAKGGGERSQRQESHQDDSPLRNKESSPWKGKAKATDSRNSRKPSSNKCFICNGDHWVRECPQRQALSSLLARNQESNNDDSCQEDAHIGSLQQLNGIQSTPKIEATGLLYADVTINGKATRAMLDTVRATKQKVKVLSALQFKEFEKVTKEKANNQRSFKITKGPQLTTSPSRATSYERERLAQHKGATHCRKRADKKRRPSRFKKGFAHCRSKKGV
ncbi:hypothetical protein V6N13_118039 [Hibiscus sabdariffa]